MKISQPCELDYLFSQQDGARSGSCGAKHPRSAFAADEAPG
jgi:hypothetical protein